MEKPLIVGFLRDRDARLALRRLDVDFVAVSSRAKILTTEYARHPRLFVTQVSDEELAETRNWFRRSAENGR